jgi:hypothetical protein
MEKLDKGTQKEVARCSVSFVTKIADGIDKICGGRGEQNQAITSHFPAVPPHHWVKLLTSDVVDTLRQQK